MYHFHNSNNQPIYHNMYPQFPVVAPTKSVVSTENNICNIANQQTIEPGERLVATRDHLVVNKAAKAKRKAAGNRTAAIDTSSYTIEERLIAAVWVHERHRLHLSFGQINRDFRERFGRVAPNKKTLLVWEKKLFSAGSVCDAPRPGRPRIRSRHVAAVRASLSGAPALSLRARAAALQLPRTTLRTILCTDLPPAPTDKVPKMCPATAKDINKHNDSSCKYQYNISNKT